MSHDFVQVLVTGRSTSNTHSC